MKHIPNTLSCLRLVMASLMLPCRWNMPVLITLYLLCGVSDVLDGYLARRLGAQSRRGAKLDSIADAVFCAAVVYLLALRTEAVLDPAVWIVAAAVALLRLGNLIVTRMRFGQWGMLHTLANKAAGLVLYGCVPVVYGLSYAPVAVTVTVGAICVLSAAEEGLILRSMQQYDPDRKSIFR